MAVCLVHLLTSPNDYYRVIWFRVVTYRTLGFVSAEPSNKTANAMVVCLVHLLTSPNDYYRVIWFRGVTYRTLGFV